MRSVGSFTHQHLGRVSYLALGGARRLGPGDRCLPSNLCSCFDDKHRRQQASGARRLLLSWRAFDAVVVAAPIVSRLRYTRRYARFREAILQASYQGAGAAAAVQA